MFKRINKGDFTSEAQKIAWIGWGFPDAEWTTVKWELEGSTVGTLYPLAYQMSPRLTGFNALILSGKSCTLRTCNHVVLKLPVSGQSNASVVHKHLTIDNRR